MTSRARQVPIREYLRYLFYKHPWSNSVVPWGSGIDVGRVFGQEQGFKPRGSLWVSRMVGYEGCAWRGVLVLTGLGIPEISHHNNSRENPAENCLDYFIVKARYLK